MYDRILVPIDGSPTSDKGVAEAIALARLTGGRIKPLHAFELPSAAIGSEAALMCGEDIYDVAREAGQQVLSKAATKVKASGVDVEQLLLECKGNRLCVLVTEAALAWSVSLIVLGSHGRRGLQRILLGSDAEQILRTATVPVLLVRDGDSRAA